MQLCFILVGLVFLNGVLELSLREAALAVAISIGKSVQVVFNRGGVES